jgi:hypothetical protein
MIMLAVMARTSTTVVSDSQLENLKRNALYSSVAYCPPEQIQAWNCIRCQAQPALQGTTNSTILNSSTDVDVRGYVAVNPSQKLIIVSFRGSSNENLLMNIQGKLESSPLFPNNQEAKIHAGFQTAHNSLRDGIKTALVPLVQQHPSFNILFCGHSLGASIATIAAVDFRINLMDRSNAGNSSKILLSTIGESRTGNVEFSSLITSLNFGSLERAVNRDDPVPRFLANSPGSFHHRSAEIWTNPNDGKTYVCNNNDNGESSDCSNTLVLSLEKFQADHRNYFDFAIGRNACFSSSSPSNPVSNGFAYGQYKIMQMMFVFPVLMAFIHG